MTGTLSLSYRGNCSGICCFRNTELQSQQTADHWKLVYGHEMISKPVSIAFRLSPLHICESMTEMFINVRNFIHG